MTDPILQQIDAVSEEFRQAWKSGRRPSIEDFLRRLPPEGRPVLFRSLLEIEIKRRNRCGEHPLSREYLQRFPQFAAQIRQAFDESTMGSLDDFQHQPENHHSGNESVAWNPGERTRTQVTATLGQLGDYELVGELGRGGMGVVHRARHRQRGNQVALKLLPREQDGRPINADRLHKFRKEFRSLSEINHPNLVGMQTLEVDGDQWFLTMDLIEGQDFPSYVRPGDLLEETRLRAALSQLARGIIALHDVGIVHRDLKPSNVMVEADGTVKILDFGLVAQLQAHSDLTVSRSGMFAGTPKYAAPEQMFGERSEASDWYAFGVMLYEALKGQAPFVGSQMELMRQKQTNDPPSLSGDDSLPKDLAQLADGLLRREPGHRLAAAQVFEVLQADLKTRNYGSTRGNSQGSSGSVDDESTSELAASDDEVILVGRESQLEGLEAAKEEFLRQREPTVVWITGKSGEGKSTLAKKFLHPLRHRNEFVVLSGRCYDRESVPFKALDSMVESLVSFLRSAPGDPYCESLPNDIQFLAQLFPLLSRISKVRDLPQRSFAEIDSDTILARGLYALRELLESVSSKTPLFILIDDLQWGDADSAKVLVDLLSGGQASRIMLLLCFRSDEAADSPFLEKWDELTRRSRSGWTEVSLSVEPLTLAQCQEMIAKRTGLVAGEVLSQAERLLEDSGGNPYFLDQLLEAFDPQTGEIKRVQIGDIIQTRLARLPEMAIGVLHVIAVAGQPISVVDLEQLIDLSVSGASILDQMRKERLVRIMAERDQSVVDTYHDKVRETVLNDLPEEKRQEIHLQIAEAIEQSVGLSTEIIFQAYDSIVGDSLKEVRVRSPRIFDLAYHFHAAADGRALAYQLAAGEEANRTHSPLEAIFHFRNASQWLSAKTDATTRYRIHFGLGRASQRSRSSAIAFDALDQAIDTAPTDLDRARAYVERSKAYQLLGQFSGTVRDTRQALVTLGRAKSEWRPLTLCRALVNTVRILYLPTAWQVHSSAKERAKSVIEHECHQVRGECIFERDAVLTIDSLWQQVVSALNSGEAQRTAIAYGDFGNIVSWLGFGGFASKAQKHCEAMSRELADPQVDAAVKSALTARYLISFQWDKCSRVTRQGMELWLRTGMNTKAHLMAHCLRHVFEWSGSTSQELGWAQKELDMGIEAGDERAQCWGHYGVAATHARAGRLAEASRAIRRAFDLIGEEKRNMTECICRLSDAFVRLQCSDYQGALASAERSWELIRKEQMLNPFTQRAYGHLLESLSGPQWRDSGTESGKYEIRRRLKRSFLVTRLVTFQRCMVNRARGRGYWVVGRKRKAIRCFQDAVQTGCKRGFQTDYAKALLDLAAVQEENREANRAEAIELLKEMESVIPRAESWLLGEQYDEQVVAPEFELEAWEAEHGVISRPAREKP